MATAQVEIAESPAERYVRLLELRRRAAVGPLSPAERREIAELSRFAGQYFGFGPGLPVETETAPEAEIIAPYTEPGDFTVYGAGASTEAADLEAQANAGRSYASFADWADDMNTAQGRAQRDFALNLVSPTRGVLSGLRAGWNAATGRAPGGYDPALGNTGWGYNIEYANNQENARGSVTDPTTGKEVDFSQIGRGHKGLSWAELAALTGESDAAASAGPGASQGAGVDISGQGTAAALGDFGYEASDFGTEGGGQEGGEAEGADGHDTDPGGDFRTGGYIPGDRDGVLEPRTIEAHETEYVIRPEAVRAVGVSALDRINRMGANPGEARQSAVMPAQLQRRLLALRERARLGPRAPDALREIAELTAALARADRPVGRARGLLRHNRATGRVVRDPAPVAVGL